MGRTCKVPTEAWAYQEPADKPSAEADKRYQRALAQMPDSIGAILEVGRSLGRTKRYERSEQVLKTGLEREPENPRLWLELAFAFERRDDIEAAEVAGRKAIALDPENPIALNFLGYLFADHERHLDESLPLIERALTHARTP